MITKYIKAFLPSLGVTLLLLGTSGCTGRKAATASVPVRPVSATGIGPGELHSALDAVFDHPDTQNAFWGVMIQSLDTGEVLYRRHAEKLFLPASNMKLLTGAAAWLQLGKEYRFRTRLLALGPVENGVLQGSLLVEGGGDPTISSRYYPNDSLMVFREWAGKLKEAGIREIRGDIVGDDDLFEDNPLGMGWSWDDVTYGYSAEFGALQCNENIVELAITPGSAAGDKVSVEILPATDYIRLRTEATTCRAEEEPGLIPERLLTENLIHLKGCAALKEGTSRLKVAVHNPTRFFVHLLRQTLISEGISVRGTAVDIDEMAVKPEKRAASVLLIHKSLPLESVLNTLLKESQNLFAETLIRAIGMEKYGLGTFANGHRVVEQILKEMAIEPASYVMVDGSGLSRYNFLSPEQLVRLLRFMYHRADFQAFYQALPIAGVDGTLAGRMKGTAAEGKVHAKTGSLANVRSLSGYVRSADGEMLAFSMIANHFTASSRQAGYLQDLALELLAGRKKSGR